ncbi:MAG: hypothetical protein ACE5FO_13840 [Parvularculaceae bacterium]
MKIPPDKRKRLAAFLGSLPGTTAAKLFAALERDRLTGGDSLPHDALIADLRRQLLDRGAGLPPRQPDARRIFFTPFEDLIVAVRRGRKRRGRISRSSFAPIWSVLTSDPACADAARAAQALDACLAGEAGDRRTLEAALFETSASGMKRLLGHAESDAAFRADLTERLGGEPAFADFAEIAGLVEGVEHLQQLQALAPRPANGLSAEELFDIRKLFVAVHADASDMAPYLLLALIGRMDAPWAALGFYYRLKSAGDEALAAAGDIVEIIPRTLFSDLEDLARGLSRDVDRNLDAQSAQVSVAYFSEFAGGLEREAQKAGDNVAVNRIEACRDVAGEALARFLEQALAALRRGLPARHAGGSSRLMALRPDIDRPPSHRLMANARAAAELLVGADDLARRLGRDLSAGPVKREAVEQARAYAQDLVKEIRAAEGADRQAARRLMECALQIAAPLLSDDEMALLRDRALAAAHAY